MNHGDKVVLSSHSVIEDVLFDGEVIFKVITIVAVRDNVPGCFTGKKIYTGYRGVDAEGFTYSYFWNSFPEDGFGTPLIWECDNPEEGEEEWYMCCDGFIVQDTAYSKDVIYVPITYLQGADVQDYLRQLPRPLGRGS